MLKEGTAVVRLGLAVHALLSCIMGQQHTTSKSLTDVHDVANLITTGKSSQEQQPWSDHRGWSGSHSYGASKASQHGAGAAGGKKPCPASHCHCHCRYDTLGTLLSP